MRPGNRLLALLLICLFLAPTLPHPLGQPDNIVGEEICKSIISKIHPDKYDDFKFLCVTQEDLPMLPGMDKQWDATDHGTFPRFNYKYSKYANLTFIEFESTYYIYKESRSLPAEVYAPNGEHMGTGAVGLSWDHLIEVEVIYRYDHNDPQNTEPADEIYELRLSNIESEYNRSLHEFLKQQESEIKWCSGCISALDLVEEDNYAYMYVIRDAWRSEYGFGSHLEEDFLFVYRSQHAVVSGWIRMEYSRYSLDHTGAVMRDGNREGWSIQPNYEEYDVSIEDVVSAAVEFMHSYSERVIEGLESMSIAPVRPPSAGTVRIDDVEVAFLRPEPGGEASYRINVTVSYKPAFEGTFRIVVYVEQMGREAIDVSGEGTSTISLVVSGRPGEEKNITVMLLPWPPIGEYSKYAKAKDKVFITLPQAPQKTPIEILEAEPSPSDVWITPGNKTFTVTAHYYAGGKEAYIQARLLAYADGEEKVLGTHEVMAGGFEGNRTLVLVDVSVPLKINDNVVDKLVLEVKLIEAGGAEKVLGSQTLEYRFLNGLAEFLVDAGADPATGSIDTKTLPELLLMDRPSVSYRIEAFLVEDYGKPDQYVLDSRQISPDLMGAVLLADMLYFPGNELWPGYTVVINITSKVEPSSYTEYRPGYSLYTSSPNYVDIYGTDAFFPTVTIPIFPEVDDQGNVKALKVYPYHRALAYTYRNCWIKTEDTDWTFANPAGVGVPSTTRYVELNVASGFQVRARSIPAWDALLRYATYRFLTDTGVVSGRTASRAVTIDVWYNPRAENSEYRPSSMLNPEYIEFSYPADRFYDPAYAATTGTRGETPLAPIIDFLHEMGHMVKEHEFPDEVELGGAHDLAGPAETKEVAYDEAHSHVFSLLARDYAVGSNILPAGIAVSYRSAMFGSYLADPRSYAESPKSGSWYEGKAAGFVIAYLYKSLLKGDSYPIQPEDALEIYRYYCTASHFYRNVTGHPPRTIDDLAAALTAVTKLSRRGSVGYYYLELHSAAGDMDLDYATYYVKLPEEEQAIAGRPLAVYVPEGQDPAKLVVGAASPYTIIVEPGQLIVFVARPDMAVESEGKAAILVLSGGGAQKPDDLASMLHAKIVLDADTRVELGSSNIHVSRGRARIEAYTAGITASATVGQGEVSLILHTILDIQVSDEATTITVVEGTVDLEWMGEQVNVEGGNRATLTGGGANVEKIDLAELEPWWDLVPPSITGSVEPTVYTQSGELTLEVPVSDDAGIASIQLIVKDAETGKEVAKLEPVQLVEGLAVFRISGLKQGKTYTTTLVAVDEAGNKLSITLNHIVCHKAQEPEPGERGGGAAVYVAVATAVLAAVAVYLYVSRRRPLR